MPAVRTKVTKAKSFAQDPLGKNQNLARKHSLAEFLQLDKLKKGQKQEMDRDQRLVFLALMNFAKWTPAQLVAELNFGVDRTTLRKLQQHFEEHGTPSKLGRPGRPLIIAGDNLEKLERFITENAAHRRLQYAEIAKQCGFNCCEDTVRQACHLLGFQKRIPRRKQLLTERQKQLRYIWAKDMKGWDEQDWMRIIWTDEASFCTSHSSYNVTVLRRPGEEYHPDCVEEELRQGRTSVMVWGAFCGTTKSDLYIVKGKVSILKFKIIFSLLMHFS